MSLEAKLTEAAKAFAAGVVAALLKSSVAELATLKEGTVEEEPRPLPKRRGRPPKVKLEAAPARKPGRPKKAAKTKTKAEPKNALVRMPPSMLAGYRRFDRKKDEEE